MRNLDGHSSLDNFPRRRSPRRQALAGPFAKGEPKPNPRKPGRKPGQEYGTKAHRLPPTPDRINEVHEAPLPNCCPDWGGPLDETMASQQFQVEIPRQPLHRQFNIHVGQCRQCPRGCKGAIPCKRPTRSAPLPPNAAVT